LARLIVISNRVAVPNRSGRVQAGGLAIGIRAILKRHPGIWFGWSGRVTSPNELTTRAIKDRGITYAVTDLVEADFQEYYNGFANRVLWPILHYRLDLAEFSRRDLTGYIRVNERFADELAKIIEPDDLIWVHDYHLMPLAKMLRDRGHWNRIGFFLHVPLPPPEILIALPNHERLIPTLGQYDLVGFQTENDATNFTRYLATVGKARKFDQSTMTSGGRIAKVGVFPIGIETAEFSRLARRVARSQFVQDVLESLSGRALIVGVDRLDYSKGLTQRMDAFERFLEAFPDWHGKVTYLQITPKSRSKIPEYAEMERAINASAGRINGTYGEAAWTPIRYVNKTHNRAALAGIYRSARAALVTPLRDGMNLVAKEFVAAQNPDDPGVLILSRFAGAAAELDAALLVNPYDPESVGMAIARALSMDLDERQRRHEVLFQAVSENDVKCWGEDFLARLKNGYALPETVSANKRPRHEAAGLRAVAPAKPATTLPFHTI
jgi:trehalose 6-phosphate synthase